MPGLRPVAVAGFVEGRDRAVPARGMVWRMRRAQEDESQAGNRIEVFERGRWHFDLDERCGIAIVG